MKDGTIESGLTSINGSLTDVTSTVQLIDNDINASVTIPGTQTFGAYTVLVMDSVNTGSSACFSICGTTSRGGSVFRAVSSTGANNENLTISWAQNGYPQLKFMALPSNGSGAMISYLVGVTREV